MADTPANAPASNSGTLTNTMTKPGNPVQAHTKPDPSVPGQQTIANDRQPGFQIGSEKTVFGSKEDWVNFREWADSLPKPAKFGRVKAFAHGNLVRTVKILHEEITEAFKLKPFVNHQFVNDLLAKLKSKQDGDFAQYIAG